MVLLFHKPVEFVLPEIGVKFFSKNFSKLLESLGHFMGIESFEK